MMKMVDTKQEKEKEKEKSTIQPLYERKENGARPSALVPT
jgi:hypothetical protein